MPSYAFPLPSADQCNGVDGRMHSVVDAAIVSPVIVAVEASLSSLSLLTAYPLLPRTTKYRLRRYTYSSLPLTVRHVGKLEWSSECPVATQLDFEIKITEQSNNNPRNASHICHRNDMRQLLGYWVAATSGHLSEYVPFQCQITFPKRVAEPDIVLRMFGDSNTRSIFSPFCKRLGFVVHMAADSWSGECFGERMVIVWSAYWLGRPIFTAKRTNYALGKFPETYEICNMTCNLLGQRREITYVSFGSHTPALSEEEILTQLVPIQQFIKNSSRPYIIGLTTAVKLDLVPFEHFDKDVGFRTNDRIRSANKLYATAFAGNAILDLWSSSLALSIAGRMSDAVHFHSEPGVYAWWANLLAHAISSL